MDGWNFQNRNQTEVVGTLKYPTLYSPTEPNFTHNGFGILSDCVLCEVSEELNGSFELYMQYPMDGIHADKIGYRSIIRARSNDISEPQLFRVYAISKPLSGIISISAAHISYDLTGIPVSSFGAVSAQNAFENIKKNAVVDIPFEFWTDVDSLEMFTNPTPASVRSVLGSSQNSILNTYGGEYEFDNHKVKLHKNRGSAKGFTIRYGKNLVDLQQEQNCADVVTGVYPYWQGTVDDETVLVELPEKIINVEGAYDFVRIKTLDFSDEFDSAPSTVELDRATRLYIEQNKIGEPEVSLTVSMVGTFLDPSVNMQPLKSNAVGLGDTVTVVFPALGVSTSAKISKMVYDSLSSRIKSVIIGSLRSNIADTIAKRSIGGNQRG